MKKTFTFLLFGILILAIFVLSQRPSGYRQALEERDRVYGERIDSIRRVQEMNAQRDSLIIRELRDSVRVLNTDVKTANTKLKAYERQKKSPPKKYTDSQIDSLLAHWYGYRRDN